MSSMTRWPLKDTPEDDEFVGQGKGVAHHSFVIAAELSVLALEGPALDWPPCVEAAPVQHAHVPLFLNFRSLGSLGIGRRKAFSVHWLGCDLKVGFLGGSGLVGLGRAQTLNPPMNWWGFGLVGTFLAAWVLLTET